MDKVKADESNSKIFDCIAKNDSEKLKIELAAYNGCIDFYDDNGKLIKY